MAAKNKIEIDPQVIEIKSRMEELVEEIKKIQVQEAETDALYEVGVEALKEKRDDRKVILETHRKHLEMQLKALFDQAPQSKTKTQRKVTLLGSDVIIKNKNLAPDYDAEKLIAYFEEMGVADKYIKVKQSKSVDWVNFKKEIEVTSEGIISKETGELLEIDGLWIKEKEEELVIK